MTALLTFDCAKTVTYFLYELNICRPTLLTFPVWKSHYFTLRLINLNRKKRKERLFLNMLFSESSHVFLVFILKSYLRFI